MEVPSTFGDPLTDAAPHLQQIRGRREAIFWPMPFGTDDPVLVQEAIAATYGMIEFIDHEVGKVLDQLDALRIAENTIVIFTSDHGDVMGEHSLMNKGGIHYQSILRVPLTVAGPGVTPGRSAGLASSLDIAPTVLDMCGLEGHRGTQGSSLRDVLGGGEPLDRDHLLVEDDLPPQVAPHIGMPTNIRTIVADGVRFSRTSDGFEELYDLHNDPTESNNRVAEDPDRRNELVTAMVDAMMAADDSAGGVAGDRTG